ncbi:protein NRT1/ PTR FAMILY 5.9 isoform X1 [Macadamia integrifolia]|uniref:protein NRT1/ PTR FAMILY 5.9 isoform X1 n=1 Tax=Macadamia integrifolia TaxID=60698 RepID=UPI001C4E66AB|nr:protein NRT1/ PTR FAMILY 5.9 isoform X1 [Macadamia integrifolia]XP_042501090.1 protein NRT1/ PTR FAMILY 5.9 isoform X1 [Macadamia integrifolia]
MDDDGRRSKGLGRSCILLIVIGGVERFAFKGVASNLITYLTDVVKMSNSSAAKTVNNWCGVTSILSLLGALVADSYWDRYSTILASSFLYVVGLAALTSTALLRAATSKTSSSLSLFWSLYLISIGQGGYNPCLQSFAADQLECDDDLPCSKDDQKTKKKSSFFQWSYFSICTGSLLGVSLMSYIQDSFGWGLGFAIPTIAMVASIVCFSCGTRSYTHKQANGGNKPFEEIILAIKKTVSKAMNSRISLPEKESDMAELELQETPLCEQEFDSSKTMGDENPNNEIVTFDLRLLLKLLPIWITLLMFAVVFQQPATFFTKQGMTMKRNIGNSFVIPPATLQSAITISIVLLMPLYDKMIIPFIQIITQTNKGINVMQRMGIGMVLSIAAMAIAAIVETKRLKVSRSGLLQSQSSTVPMSIFWLLPQYIFLGISDVFTVVGMQEFFYTQMPSRMRTMGIALYLSVFGVGSFLSALLISVVEIVTSTSRHRQSWFSDNLSEASLDCYYWLLTLLSTLSLLVFVCLCKYYKQNSK